MRLTEFDEKALAAKMQALIDDPNAHENIKAVARKKLDRLNSKKNDSSNTSEFKYNDFAKDDKPGIYTAKGEFKPFDMGRSEFKPMSMSDFVKKK